MEKILEKKDKGGDKGGDEKKEKGGDEKDIKAISALSSSMVELIKVLSKAKLPDPSKGKQLAAFVVNFATGIEDAIKKIDEKKTKEFTKLLEVMLKGASKFVIQMALVAVLTPIAMIGIAGFGYGMVILTKILEKASDVKKKTFDGIKSLMSVASGVALFMLVMVGISFVASKVAFGFLVFFMVIQGLAITLRIASMLAGGGFGLMDKGPLSSLAKLARGIALFTLTLVLIALAAPIVAVGFLVFALVIMGLAVVLRIVSVIASGGFNPTDKGPLGDLSRLGIGIAMFVVTLVLVSFVKAAFIIGALLVMLAIAAFGLILVGLSKMLKTGDKPLSTKGQFDAKDAVTDTKSTGPLADILKMSKALFIFALTAVAVGFFIREFAMGALGLVLAMLAVGLVVDKVYGSGKILQGSSNLRHVSFSLGIFVGALALYALLVMPKLTWDGIGMLGAVIGVMGLVGTVLGMKPIDKYVKAGAASLILLGGALVVFSFGLSIYAQHADKLDWNKIGMLGAVIVGMGVAAGIIGAIEMSSGVFPITVGSAVMIVMGIALITFATGISIYAQHADKLSWEKIGMLGGIITTLAVAGGAIGLVAPLVGLGAGVLILLGLALIPLARGLSIFAKADWTDTDSEGLKHALHSIILGMFGYEKMSDIGIQAAVWIPSLIGFLLGTSAAFVVASKAMLPLSKALKIFKSANWTMADSINLQFALSSIANAFAKIAEGDNWHRTMLGIYGMRDVGGTLISLAAGIQAMANMTFTEYEWDETTKKLEPKRKVKLTKDDVKLAGDNASYVISVLAEPLARFGAFVSGKASFMVNGVPLASDFMSVIMGISALGGLGKSLSSLSEGVQAWASMSYWEYDLVFNPQTGMKELKPSKKRKITPAEIKEAVTNIATVMTAMIVPVSAFGIMMAGGNLAGGPLAMLGITKNPIEKGIAGLGNLGKSIISLADGVRDWATMSYWEYDLQLNPKTGMSELLPSKKRKLTKAEIEEAITNIATVMTAMIVPVAAFGTLMAGGNLAGGPLAMLGIGKNPIEQGIAGIGNIGKSIASLADGVLKFARMQFVEWEVKNVNGKNELVPKGIVKVDESVINTAIDNIGLVLSAGARAVINFEKEIISGGMFGGFYTTLGKVNDMTNSFGKVYDVIRKIFSDGKALGVVMGNFKYFFEKLFEPLQIEKTMQLLAFNTQFERYINNTLSLSQNYTKLDLTLSPLLVLKYDNFTKITERLANIATPFEKFVKSFGEMAKHMGVFAINFKVMDVKGISAFKDWTESMVQISKVDIGKSEGIVKFINDSVSAAFGGGKSTAVGDKKPQEYSEADKRSQTESMMQPGGSAQSQQQQQPAQIDTEAIISAIQQGFSSITVDSMTVLKMKTGR
jgi:hypothetical protein